MSTRATARKPAKAAADRHRTPPAPKQPKQPAQPRHFAVIGAGIAGVACARTLAVLLWPLVRRARPEAPSEDAARVAVYRDQKRQLDDDVAAGVLSPADHATALDELARRLGAAARETYDEWRQDENDFAAAYRSLVDRVLAGER